jgi:TnpA family transposase
LRELGRLERTLFMIEWYSSPALRRRCQAGPNKGEATHKLKRAVFFRERGEIRDRSFARQAFRASGLRHQGRIIPDNVLKHVSPLGWEHIT